MAGRAGLRLRWGAAAGAGDCVPQPSVSVRSCPPHTSGRSYRLPFTKETGPEVPSDFPKVLCFHLTLLPSLRKGILEIKLSREQLT